MNVLALGAHFDDIEIGCGGTIAKHRKNGDNVIALVITDSKYNNHDGTLVRDRETAFKEGQKAAKILGYDLHCLNYKTKEVEFNSKLIEDINKIIDAYEINLIYTHWDSDVHQDHQATGKATLSAGRKINNILMYQSNLYPNTRPFHKNYYVDISQQIDLKIQAIKAHKSEVKKFGADWVDFWADEAKYNGRKVGVSHAESFQVVSYLA